MKPEINCIRKTCKFINVSKLNNTLQEPIGQKVTREIRKYPETNRNAQTQHSKTYEVQLKQC